MDKLRPCPSYSRRRDRINLGLWRSLYGGGGVADGGTWELHHRHCNLENWPRWNGIAKKKSPKVGVVTGLWGHVAAHPFSKALEEFWMHCSCSGRHRLPEIGPWGNQKESLQFLFCLPPPIRGPPLCFANFPHSSQQKGALICQLPNCVLQAA